MSNRDPRTLCGPGCDRRRHAVIRKLTNAVEKLKAASDAVMNLPEPEDDEVKDWQGVREDLAGMLWALRIAATCIESCHLSCCAGDRSAQDTLWRRGEDLTQENSERVA